jgi:hypothetical protein
MSGVSRLVRSSDVSWTPTPLVNLGSILYEINTLPWEFDGEVKVTKAKYGESNLWGLPIVVGSEHDTFHVGKQFVSLSVTAAAVVLVVSAYVQLKRRLIAYQRIA